MDYFLTITGKSAIESELNPEKEISVAFKRLGIYKTELTEDSITYKAKNLDYLTIIDGDDVIKGQPKKSSPSQVLRFKLRDLWEQQYMGDGEFDTFYNKKMSEYIDEVDKKLI